MENSNKKRQFILSLIGIFLLILFSVGVVFAFFNYSRTGTNNNVLSTTSLTFSFDDSDWIWLENAFPISTEKALTLESTGNGLDLNEADGGLARFRVIGGHASGQIHYYISLVKEDLTQTTTSVHGTYSLDPSTKIGQLPDGAIDINVQTSLSNIFEETGLVNDPTELLYPEKSFTPAYAGGSYVNTNGSVSIDKLPLNDNNERVIGTGIMSGTTGIRYFELRMWVNESVMQNDVLRAACISNNSNEVTNGRGYCNPTTANLPEGIKYVYSSGEYGKLYYSNRIKVETTDISTGQVDKVPPITETLLSGISPTNDSGMSFNTTATTNTGLVLMNSTVNSPYPVYYYRGAVDNNNVIFANFCWKIVRTTETGGTKLIYNGVPNGGTCNNTGTATHIKTSKFTSSNISPAYVGYKYGSTHPNRSSKSSSDLSTMGVIAYGKNVTYANGKYSLTGTVGYDGADYETDYEDTGQYSIRYLHYSCLSNATTCSTVYYIYYLTSNTMYYYPLTGGQTHLDLLNEMLVNDGSVNSIAYNELNAWYTANLLTYASQLEDTVFCNDRSIADYGGWDINNANTSYLYFGAYGRLYTNKTPSLTCQNPGDRFTVNSSNGNGQLEYPVGLLTADEYALAGAVYDTSNSSFYLYNNQYQWSLSPSTFDGTDAYGFNLNSTGYSNSTDVGNTAGLRPVISLKKDEIFVEGGEGTTSNPYIVQSLF